MTTAGFGLRIAGWKPPNFAGGRPKVEEIMAYFPALIPKSLITPKVEIIEA